MKTATKTFQLPGRQPKVTVLVMIFILLASFIAYDSGLLTTTTAKFLVRDSSQDDARVEPLAIPLDQVDRPVKGLVVCINFNIANCVAVEARALAKGRPYVSGEECTEELIRRTSQAEIVFIDGNLTAPADGPISGPMCATMYKAQNMRVVIVAHSIYPSGNEYLMFLSAISVVPYEVGIHYIQ